MEAEKKRDAAKATLARVDVAGAKTRVETLEAEAAHKRAAAAKEREGIQGAAVAGALQNADAPAAAAAAVEVAATMSARPSGHLGVASRLQEDLRIISRLCSRLREDVTRY